MKISSRPAPGPRPSRRPAAVHEYAHPRRLRELHPHFFRPVGATRQFTRPEGEGSGNVKAADRARDHETLDLGRAFEDRVAHVTRYCLSAPTLGGDAQTAGLRIAFPRMPYLTGRMLTRLTRRARRGRRSVASPRACRPPRRRQRCHGRQKARDQFVDRRHYRQSEDDIGSVSGLVSVELHAFGIAASSYPASPPTAGPKVPPPARRSTAASSSRSTDSISPSRPVKSWRSPDRRDAASRPSSIWWLPSIPIATRHGAASGSPSNSTLWGGEHRHRVAIARAHSPTLPASCSPTTHARPRHPRRTPRPGIRSPAARPRATHHRRRQPRSPRRRRRRPPHPTRRRQRRRRSKDADTAIDTPPLTDRRHVKVVQCRLPSKGPKARARDNRLWSRGCTDPKLQVERLDASGSTKQILEGHREYASPATLADGRSHDTACCTTRLMRRRSPTSAAVTTSTV